MTVGFMAQDPAAIGGGDDRARLGRIGHNTGNRAFAYAMRQHLTDDVDYLTWDADPADVRDRCDVIVVPEASAANPVRDFSARADFIERVDRPVVVAGLGAQARKLGDPVALTDGTVRYLRALADRTTAIGVRGEFSGEVLAAYGVSNTVVTGCPSNLIHPDPELGRSIEAQIAGATERGGYRRIAVTQGDQKNVLRNVEQHLVDWVRTRGGTVIYQSGAALLAARSDTGAMSLKEQAKLRTHLGIAPWRSWGRRPLSALIGADTRVFFGIAEWREFLAGMDLAIGTRIHGNILAVQSGRPGACVHHDSRTEELSRTTRIPHLTVAACEAAATPEAAMAATGFDGAAYDANRADLARTYRDLLVAGGLTPSIELDGLAGEG